MGRRPALSEAKKAEVVKEVRDGAPVAALAARYGVSPTAIYSWVKAARDEAGRLGRDGQFDGALPDLSSLMEEVELARRFKAFISSLGYIKPRTRRD